MLTARERAQVIGDRIRAARKRRGMSQVELARRLAERYGRQPESVRRAIVNYETGKYSPRLHILQSIAEATDTPLAFFAIGDEEATR